MFYFESSQKIPISIDQAWEFFSSPKNLKILTPEYLNFEMITERQDEKMYAGQIIGYKIHPLFNVPITWITEITQVRAPHFFIDEQRFGPYTFWHHEHRFIPIENGIEMVDIIYYKLPFGLIGKLFHSLKVKEDINNIFSFRHAKLIEMFGAYPEETN